MNAELLKSSFVPLRVVEVLKVIDGAGITSKTDVWFEMYCFHQIGKCSSCNRAVFIGRSFVDIRMVLANLKNRPMDANAQSKAILREILSFILIKFSMNDSCA